MTKGDPNFSVFTGHEFLILVGLQMGCDGCVGGVHNLCPHIAVSLFEAFEKGDIAKAYQMQQDLIATWQLFRYGSIWGGYEEALRYLGICDRAVGRPYTMSMTESDRQGVRKILDQYVKPYLEVPAAP